MTVSALNPYTPMMLTYNSTRFYGRENEVASILKLITAPEPGSHAIYGLRTIGKTTLLKFLKDPDGATRKYELRLPVAYRPGGNHRLLFIYLNFHLFTREDSVFYLMLEQLDEELQDQQLTDMVQLTDYTPESSRQQLVGLLRRTLQRLSQQEIRVVFLLDDFDTPLRIIDNYDDGLLRTLSDHAALIIATEDPITVIRPDIDESSPLLGILRPDAIGLISEPAARELIHHPLTETDISFGDREVDLLLYTAGRQPFILISACELYFDTRQEYPDTVNQLRDTHRYHALQTQFLSRLVGQLHVERVLRSTWQHLVEHEHKLLIALTDASKLDIATEKNSIAARLESLGLLVWDARSGKYLLFSAVLIDFIRRTTSMPEPLTPYREMLPESSSDLESLTPIDSALLRHFLAHRDQTLTFDELLNAVWSDSDKSKRALEAAVHRIRQVIRPRGDIKNIRGIGYRYIGTGF